MKEIIKLNRLKKELCRGCEALPPDWKFFLKRIFKKKNTNMDAKMYSLMKICNFFLARLATCLN